MLKPLYDPARIETFLEEFGLLFELADALGSALRLERARAPATPAETSHPEIQHGFRGL